MSVEPFEHREEAAIGAALRGLPAVTPPPDGWLRLQAAIRRDAIAQQRPTPRRISGRRWLPGLALAASLAVAALLLQQLPQGVPEPDADPIAEVGAPATATAVATTSTSEQLIEQSAQLEAVLSWLVAGSASAESLALDLGLVDRLQWIDHLLADPAASAATREVLWRERVDLLRQRVRLNQRDALAANSNEWASATTL